MRRNLLFAAIAMASFAATQMASAADMPIKASVATAYNWTGLYAGGNIGYGWARDTGGSWTSYTDSPPPTLGVGLYFPGGGNVLPGVKPQGVLGGLQIGYNWQVSPILVLGAVTDIQASGMKASASALGTPGCCVPTTQSNEAKIQWFGTARGKAGYAADKWLIYATGGLAYGKVEENAAFNCAACGPPQFFAGSSSKTKTGWVIGAGLDYALTRNWILGAEYLYFDLGSIATTAILTSGTNVNTTFSSNAKFRGSIARVTVDYKFN